MTEIVQNKRVMWNIHYVKSILYVGKKVCKKEHEKISCTYVVKYHHVKSVIYLTKKVCK